MALTEELISYYKCDESSGNLADAHGSNTLTNNNTATYSAGVINNGADMESSSNQYFSIADASQTGLDFTTSFTFACWLKPEGITGSHTLFSKWNDATQKSYLINFTATDVQIATSSNGTSETNGSWSYATGTGTWKHYVITKSSTVATFYVNGVSQGTQTVVGSCFDGSDAFYIGRRGDASQYYDGMVDEVGIWSRALGTGEISSLYNAGNGLAYPLTVTNTSRLLLLGVS